MNLKEIKQLLKYCIDNHNFNFVGYYEIITAIYTGARVSEILGLTWDDLTPEYIDINKTWNYKLHKFGTTKNKFSIRKISIPHELYTMLLELKSNNSNMIFETVRGIPNSKSLNKTLRATLKRLNINKQGFHFHSLRHSHVAYLISQGFDLYTISKRLGHADTTITSRTYAYLLEEHKKETDELIRRSLDKL